MKKIFLLFSHKLTDVQMDQLDRSYGIQEFLYLPKMLQDLWSEIPPDADELQLVLDPFKKLLTELLDEGDYILIQGDFGATHIMVNWSKTQNYIPLHATTNRIHQEKILPNGDVEMIKTFKHIKFRKYE